MKNIPSPKSLPTLTCSEAVKGVVGNCLRQLVFNQTAAHITKQQIIPPNTHKVIQNNLLECPCVPLLRSRGLTAHHSVWPETAGNAYTHIDTPHLPRNFSHCRVFSSFQREHYWLPQHGFALVHMTFFSNLNLLIYWNIKFSWKRLRTFLCSVFKNLLFSPSFL